MVSNSVSCLVIGFFCLLCSVLESSRESHRSPVFWILRSVWRFGVRPVLRSVSMSLWGFRGKSVGWDNVVSVGFSVGHGVGVASPTRYYRDVGVLFASLEVGVSTTRYLARESIRVHGSAGRHSGIGRGWWLGIGLIMCFLWIWGGITLQSQLVHHQPRSILRAVLVADPYVLKTCCV